MSLDDKLDQTILNIHVAGMAKTIAGVYAIFREAEILAYSRADVRVTRDRANQAYSALVGYPITWPAGSSFYYGRTA